MPDRAKGIDSVTNERLLVEAAAKADREETVVAIRAGLADVAAKCTTPARGALTALANKHGIADA
jgi:hydroxyethylthiazole kinase-like sugar kinase family protein